jgi:Xaa-Pro aminopeptidase
MINRRHILSGAAAGAVAGSLGPSALSAADSPVQTELVPPDLGFLKDSPLMNHDRARFFMEREGLDALVVTRPQNVFYVTNHWSQLERMGYTNTAMAVFPRDPKRPIALIMVSFLYYYTHSPETDFEDRLVFPYSGPMPSDDIEPGMEPAAVPTRTRRENGIAPTSALNLRRKAMLANTEPVSAGPDWALSKALKALGVDHGVLGIDDPILESVIRSRGIDAELRPAENTVRRIRLAKSPSEIRLMRLAAQQNVDAAVAAARAARDVGTTRALRARFYSEAALRGNLGVFMVVNSTSSEVVDQPIVDGMAFSIDCVSHCRFYHGDFARTIFVGEPHPYMRRACSAIETAWHEIRSQLRPGMRFVDIPPIGKATLTKLGMDLKVSFSPHSVGMYHTDHPRPSLLEPRTIEGLVLEENMVLSVDCPPMEAGIGGTAHLEDLMLITKDGAEPLHSIPQGVFTV